MDFRPHDTLAPYREQARAWVADNVDPKWADEQERTGTYHSHELHARLAADGFLGAEWPAEYGGGRVDPDLMTAVLQEILASGLHLDGWTTTLMVLNTVLHVGTEEQKREWLGAAAAAKMLIVLGYTEPGSGSDVAAAKTRAVRDGDEWILNGSKMFTSTAHEATHVFLLCRTNPDVGKHRGLTLFMVPLDSPGVEIRPVYTLGGQRTNATFYTDVRVSDSMRVGDVDGGWGVMRVALVYERGIPLIPAGPSWAERAAQWAADTPAGDGSVLDDQVVRDQLAHIAIENEISKLLATRVAWVVESGGMPAVEGTVNKLYGPEHLQRQLSGLLDLIGTEGALHNGGFPGDVESAFRKSVVGTIYGGSSEIMREIIAERMLDLPRSRPTG